MTTGPEHQGEMHPFVALMRRYCIDYTNSHDQSTYPDIFEADYTVHIEGHDLVRDESYGPAAAKLFAQAPGLGLVVHELVLNGERLCMRFSEHAAMPTPEGRRLACWPGIGLYRWNGRRLTENFVEQDFVGQRRQLDRGVPDPLEPPHIDPWLTTRPVDPVPAVEETVRSWLGWGALHDAPRALIDTTVCGSDDDAGAASEPLVVEAHDVTVNDLFSAGPRVAFHVTLRGPYRGGVPGVAPEAVGAPVDLHVAGLALVVDGHVDEVRVVTSRRAVRHALRAPSPGTGAGARPARRRE